MSEDRRGVDPPQDPTADESYAAFYAEIEKAADLCWKLVAVSHLVNQTRESLSNVLANMRRLIEAMPEPQAAKEQFTALVALLDLRLGAIDRVCVDHGGN